MIGRPLSLLLLALIRVYQWFISPMLAGTCRFSPTCSQYAIEAIGRHGPVRGAWMALRRFARCRPGGGFGIDPVADARTGGAGHGAIHDGHDHGPVRTMAAPGGDR